MASMRDLVTSMSFFVECLSLVQPRWFGVEVRYVRDLDRQVTLDELKKHKCVLCRA
jgi:predicted RNA-binding protein with PUA-like domain